MRIETRDQSGGHVQWTIVLDTAERQTALRLVQRVLHRLTAIQHLTLAPWEAKLTQSVLTAQQPLPPGMTDGAIVAHVMADAAALSATWTLDLAPDPGSELLFQGWTPHEYRRFVLDGLYASHFHVRSCPPASPEGARARLHTLPDGGIVRILEG